MLFVFTLVLFAVGVYGAKRAYDSWQNAVLDEAMAMIEGEPDTKPMGSDKSST